MAETKCTHEKKEGADFREPQRLRYQPQVLVLQGCTTTYVAPDTREDVCVLAGRPLVVSVSKGVTRCVRSRDVFLRFSVLKKHSLARQVGATPNSVALADGFLLSPGKVVGSSSALHQVRGQVRRVGSGVGSEGKCVPRCAPPNSLRSRSE